MRERRMRTRRQVHPLVLTALRPLFRESYAREAWVLRGVGNRFGPVLRPSDPRSRDGRVGGQV